MSRPLKIVYIVIVFIVIRFLFYFDNMLREGVQKRILLGDMSHNSVGGGGGLNLTLPFFLFFKSLIKYTEYFLYKNIFFSPLTLSPFRLFCWSDIQNLKRMS